MAAFIPDRAYSIAQAVLGEAVIQEDKDTEQWMGLYVGEWFNDGRNQVYHSGRVISRFKDNDTNTVSVVYDDGDFHHLDSSDLDSSDETVKKAVESMVANFAERGQNPRGVEYTYPEAVKKYIALDVSEDGCQGSVVSSFEGKYLVVYANGACQDYDSIDILLEI